MTCAVCDAPYPCIWDEREFAWQDFDGFCYLHAVSGCGSEDYCELDWEEAA